MTRKPEVCKCETCNDLAYCTFDPTIDLWLCKLCLEDEISEIRLVPVAGELQSLPAPAR